MVEPHMWSSVSRKLSIDYCYSDRIAMIAPPLSIYTKDQAECVELLI